MTIVYDPLTYRTVVARPGEVPYKFWSVNKLVIDAAAAGMCTLHSGDEAPGDTSKLWLDLTMPENAVGSVKAYDGAAWVTLTPQLYYSHIAGGATGFVTDSEMASAIAAAITAATGVSIQAYSLKLKNIADASWVQGDVMYFNGTSLVRLPAGTSGEFLKTNGSGANPAWATPAGAGDVTAASNFGTNNAVLVADGTGKGAKSSGVTITSGRLKSNGSGYVVNPDGPVFGQYDSTTGYFQMPAGGSFQFWNGGTGVVCGMNDNGRVVIGQNFSPSYQFSLTTDSAAKPSTSTWTVASDERLKESIEAANLNRCWEIVETIPLKHYRWKDETYTVEQTSDRSKLGWIAQDVKPAFKNAVTPFKFTKAIDIADGVEEYQEQETVSEVVKTTEATIEIVNGVPTLVTVIKSETIAKPVFDDLAVVNESGAPVLDAAGAPVTHPVPRMVTKTRQKFRRETIDDCLSLNTDQLYAAMYGALQLAMQKIKTLESEVAALKVV
jgi:hypothetical protein